jgi:hypothetical protein
MIDATCHCGAVRLSVDSAPTSVTSCNCSICRRLGTLWAYYAPANVHVTGRTVAYRWGEGAIEFHHCPTCGCTTHWSATKPPFDRTGVNARLMDPAIVAAARTRRVDGAADTWTSLDDEGA